MHTCTTTIQTARTPRVSRVSRAARSTPLMLRDRARSRRGALNAGPLVPVMREAAGPDRRAAELQAVLEALADPRAAGDRVLDRVVDRLLWELGA